MPVVVEAGKTVKATIDVVNAGQQKGTFRLQGQIFYASTTNLAGNFFVTQGYSSTNPPPSGANIKQFELGPGAPGQVIMYSGVWADGRPTAFPSAQLFDVLWTLTCVETGQSVTRTDRNALQHQTLTPPQAQITNVTYTVI